MKLKTLGLLSIFFIAACGSDKKNELPQVTITPNIELNEDESLSITANATDPDGSIENIVWKYESGLRLNTSNSGNTLSLEPIDISKDETSVYSVTVTDNSGDTATATTTINTRYINNPPSVSINVFDVISEGETGNITLNINDIDNNIYSVSWREITSNDLVYSVDENFNLSFEAPDVNEDMVYELEVTVEDVEGEIDTDTISFTVMFVNEPPTAILPEFSTIDFGQTLEVSGENSFDQDNQSLSYTWSILSVPDGSNANLINSDTSIVTFDYDLLGSYTIGLTVNDGITSSEMVSQSFSVTDVLNSLTINLNKPNYPLNEMAANEIPLGETLSPTIIANFNAVGEVDVTSESNINVIGNAFNFIPNTNEIKAINKGIGDIEVTYEQTTELFSNFEVVDAVFSELKVQENFNVYEGREVTVIPEAVFTDGQTSDYEGGEWTANNPEQTSFSILNNFTFLAAEPGQETFIFNTSNENVNDVTTTVKSKDISEVANSLTMSEASAVSSINGIITRGSKFSATLTNTFSESLVFNSIETLDGDNRSDDFTLDELIAAGITDDDNFEINEQIGISVTIGLLGAKYPYKITFNLTDPITGKDIKKIATFESRF
jgi:hypothetical protein